MDVDIPPEDSDPAQKPATPATAPLRPPDTAPLPDIDALEEGGTRQLSGGQAPMLAALRSRRQLACAAQRDIGRVRELNQDSVFALLTSVPREGANVPLGLFVVADGMGGHEGGEVASRLAVRVVVHHVLEHLLLPALDESFAEALQPLMIAAVQEANDTIYTHASAIGSDMGTTCTAALLLGNACYVAHVGDSRLYLRTPGALVQVTDDHSAVGRLIQLGQLDAEAAREHPLRSQLYRTVGQMPQVPVDFFYQPIGDATHLLVCSDGLWGMLDDPVLDEVLEQSLWPQDACQELIARANLAGGDDNISAVVVSLPAPEGQRL
jgi:PPM family protein phosphatase